MLIGLDRIVEGSISMSCRRERERALEYMKSSTTPVVISVAWNGYGPGSLANRDGKVLDMRSIEDHKRAFRDALERSLEYLGSRNRKFLIVGRQVEHSCDLNPHRVQPGPLNHAPAPHCPPLDARKAHEQVDDMDSMLMEFQKSQPQSVIVLRPVDYLCGTECPVMNDGRWLYQDGTHMTVAGAQYVASRAGELLARFVQSEENRR